MQLSSPLQSLSCTEIHQVITHRVVVSGYLTGRRSGKRHKSLLRAQCLVPVVVLDGSPVATASPLNNLLHPINNNINKHDNQFV